MRETSSHFRCCPALSESQLRAKGCKAVFCCGVSFDQPDFDSIGFFGLAASGLGVIGAAVVRPLGAELRSVSLKLADAMSASTANSGKAIHFLSDAKTTRETGAIVIKTGLSLQFSFEELNKTRVGKSLWR